jgi:hypothetical protein
MRSGDKSIKRKPKSRSAEKIRRPLNNATLPRPTTRDDVIAFFDKIADQPHSVLRIVVLDNAAIHKGDAM